MIRLYYIAVILLSTVACKKHAPQNDPLTPGNSFRIDISTDKACYAPGNPVTFNLNREPPAGTHVRYMRLNETLGEGPVSGMSWQWTAPPDDYKGYLAHLFTKDAGEEKVLASIAIDISTDWKYFPRYGFLSAFGKITNDDMDKVVSRLNRYHINGVQFQDWQYKHHQPLAGTATNPMASWKDIANRDNYLSTVSYYIAELHERNMKAMFYNLAFGALNDAGADGVSEEWYLFKDKSHNNKDKHPLPKPPFKSDIYMTNPANPDWQQYMADRNKAVYAVFDFDGYHIDQLGDRGPEYDYQGNAVNLAETYLPFMEAMKAAATDKRLVMNAVNQYGQTGIAAGRVDFLYTEVWSPNEGYKDLAALILQNDGYNNPSKKTVLAAYLNYNLADNPGYFNTPGVLLADAVIFAFGGAHLELGEHMLGKEYFPNNNLQMKDELQSALVNYYDFLVAYQNLLRDGGQFNSVNLTCTNGKLDPANWPPQSGKVAVVGKEFTGKQVIHLLNFANAFNFEWRDSNGKQTEPHTIVDAVLSIPIGKKVRKAWYASPDTNEGVPVLLSFTQANNYINLTLPYLKYWDMIVLEYN